MDADTWNSGLCTVLDTPGRGATRAAPTPTARDPTHLPKWSASFSRSPVPARPDQLAAGPALAGRFAGPASGAAQCLNAPKCIFQTAAGVPIDSAKANPDRRLLARYM